MRLLARSFTDGLLHCKLIHDQISQRFICQLNSTHNGLQQHISNKLLKTADAKICTQVSKSVPKSRAKSLARQNFHEDCEAGINKQINMELYASYTYQAMYFHFSREDVALKGIAEFFNKSSQEEREHAEKLMKYQNTRGGSIVLQDIQKPAKKSWGSMLEAMMDALELEKTVNQSLLELHEIADNSKDPQTCDFIESYFLEEQVEAIKDLADHVTNLKRVGIGLGEHIYDRSPWHSAAVDGAAHN